jgi:hypothetical protein
MRSSLVDEYVLLIHSLILGSGRCLFPDDSPTTARSVRSLLAIDQQLGEEESHSRGRPSSPDRDGR